MSARELPAGTVTFLFTDIEGSTKLLHELGAEAYAQALGDHKRIVREECAEQGGVEVDTQGDAFFLAFPTAPGALEAARTICERLEATAIRVRMGVHTGTPLLTDEGYVGPDVHRAARVAAAGHGGQMLVSSTTAALVAAPLRDLGEHRLKDLSAPERIYQLGERNFPRLKSLHQTNLPVPASSFLGRERELREVVALATRPDMRLLTLTGPGGTGKTRLALQAAAESSDAFPDGVFWVPLAPLREPSVFLSTVTQALELSDESRRSAEALRTMLANKRLLLLLDNAEHLLPEIASEVVRLIPARGSLLLVTSRERLQVQGEQLYPVPPMDDRDGVVLFHTRARALDPAFAGNGAVHELCLRLDNLPLALELAAARTVVFSPEQLLERLSHRLDLLKGGRDADPRQQTLRATIEWSYELLETQEQLLLRSLSVFAGGCMYDAAETVCHADPDGLQSLLDKSLVRKRDTELGTRYWMLETIREYAAERLEESHAGDDMRTRHAGFFLELAETLGLAVEAFASSTPQRHDVALAERDNFRAAIDWALERDPRLGLRIAIALEQHWVSHNPFEGKRRYEALLARAGELPLELRAQALRSLGGATELAGEFDAAERLYSESLELYERIGDQWGIVHLRHRLANCAVHRGDWESALPIYEDNLARAREAGWGLLEAEALGGVADAAWNAGDLQRCYELLEEGLERCRELRWTWGEANSLQDLGELALELGRPPEAEECGRAALELAGHMEGRLNSVRALALLAAAARARGADERAGMLWGAVEAEEERRGPLGRGEPHRNLLPRIVTSPSHAFDRGLDTGRRLTLDEATESMRAGGESGP